MELAEFKHFASTHISHTDEKRCGIKNKPLHGGSHCHFQPSSLWKNSLQRFKDFEGSVRRRRFYIQHPTSKSLEVSQIWSPNGHQLGVAKCRWPQRFPKGSPLSWITVIVGRNWSCTCFLTEWQAIGFFLCLRCRLLESKQRVWVCFFSSMFVRAPGLEAAKVAWAWLN